MKKNLLIPAVVVWYNPNEENKNQITKYINAVDKLYIVDNSDDDILRIKSNGKIEYIKLNENIGIAEALNIGAKKAIDDGYDWLLTLDQDSEITESIINSMKEFLNKNINLKNIGLISPYQSIDEEKIVEKNEYDDVTEIMTSGNIINLDAYKKIGGYKSWLFIDYVDIEYCLNLHKNGYSVLRLNNIIMTHHLGNPTYINFFGKTYHCSNHNSIRRYYIMRNVLYIRDMYKDSFKEYTNKLLKIQKGQIKRITLFEKNKFQKLKMTLKGYIDYRKGIKGKLKK